MEMMTTKRASSLKFSVAKDTDLKDKIAVYKSENGNLKNQLIQRTAALNTTRTTHGQKGGGYNGNKTRFAHQIYPQYESISCRQQS